MQLAALADSHSDMPGVKSGVKRKRSAILPISRGILYACVLAHTHTHTHCSVVSVSSKNLPLCTVRDLLLARRSKSRASASSAACTAINRRHYHYRRYLWPDPLLRWRIMNKNKHWLQWRSQGEGHRKPGPSETLRIFCHKSLEFQVSGIGAVQEDRFCCYATHQESQLHNSNCMHGACAVYSLYAHPGSVTAGNSSVGNWMSRLLKVLRSVTHVLLFSHISVLLSCSSLFR